MAIRICNFGQRAFKVCARTVTLAFLAWAALFAVSSDAQAQDKAELLRSLDAMVKVLEKEKSADREVVKALKNLEASVNTLLGKADADLGSELDAAAERLGQNLTDTDIADQVATMRGQVFAYEKRQRDPFVKMLAEALKEALETKGDLTLGNATLVALSDVEDIVAVVKSEDRLAAIKMQAARLTTALAPPNAADILSGEVVLSELTTLLATLRTVEEAKFYPALATRLDATSALIGDAKKLRPLLRLSDLNRVSALRGKLNVLLADDKDVHTGVHIVSATYGRVSGPKQPGDTCDARPTVVQSCQAKASCNVDAAAFGKLCGGRDPAPFIEGQNKGLRVEYLCLVDVPKRTWNDLMRAGSGNFGGRASSIVLRSSSDGFKCAVD